MMNQMCVGEYQALGSVTALLAQSPYVVNLETVCHPSGTCLFRILLKKIYVQMHMFYLI